MAKEITFRGKSLAEVKQMSLKEFSGIIPARQRRSLIRGLSDEKKKFLAKVGKKSGKIETHLRDMIIVPAMLDKLIMVHTGKEFVPVKIEPDMLGHYLGEFAPTRRRVAHHAPGIGATKSSSSLSVK